MRIISIQNNQYRQNSKAFGSFHRDVVSKPLFCKEKLLYRNDTSFFRDCDFWPKLSDYLIKKYKDVPKVNVYSYGCSEGSEPYTFIMSMVSKLGENAKKFFPVIAKDRDFFVINLAKSRDWYFLKDEEKAVINANTRSCFNRFFKEIDSNYVFVTDELYDNVNFSVADINKDYKKISPKNSIVFVRNFWPYLKDNDARQKLLNNLYKQLDKDSMIIIGLFDKMGTNYEIIDLVTNAGFKPTKIDFVYEKLENNTGKI